MDGKYGDVNFGFKDASLSVVLHRAKRKTCNLYQSKRPNNFFKCVLAKCQNLRLNVSSTVIGGGQESSWLFQSIRA